MCAIIWMNPPEFLLGNLNSAARQFWQWDLVVDPCIMGHDSSEWGWESSHFCGTGFVVVNQVHLSLDVCLFVVLLSTMHRSSTRFWAETGRCWHHALGVFNIHKWRPEWILLLYQGLRHRLRQRAVVQDRNKPTVGIMTEWAHSWPLPCHNPESSV